MVKHNTSAPMIMQADGKRRSSASNQNQLILQNNDSTVNRNPNECCSRAPSNATAGFKT